MSSFSPFFCGQTTSSPLDELAYIPSFPFESAIKMEEMDGGVRPSPTPATEIDLFMPDFVIPEYGRTTFDKESSSSSDKAASNAKQDNFLYKLWRFILDNPQSDIIYWSDIGSYLIIPSEEALVEEVILKLYKQKDYSSFARQLNIYGWKRLNPSQLRGAEAQELPPNCRIWRHDFLTRASHVNDLQRVKRNAIQKKKPTKAVVHRGLPNRPLYENNRPAGATTQSARAPVYGVRKRSLSETHAQFIPAARMLNETLDKIRPGSAAESLPEMPMLPPQSMEQPAHFQYQFPPPQRQPESASLAQSNTMLSALRGVDHCLSPGLPMNGPLPSAAMSSHSSTSNAEDSLNALWGSVTAFQTGTSTPAASDASPNKAYIPRIPTSFDDLLKSMAQQFQSSPSHYSNSHSNNQSVFTL